MYRFQGVPKQNADALVVVIKASIMDCTSSCCDKRLREGGDDDESLLLDPKKITRDETGARALKAIVDKAPKEFVERLANSKNIEKCYDNICMFKGVHAVPIDRDTGRICGHNFHRDCLEEWLEKNDTCPMCRHPSHSAISWLFGRDEYEVFTLLEELTDEHFLEPYSLAYTNFTQAKDIKIMSRGYTESTSNRSIDALL